MAAAAITPEPPFVKDTWMTDENLFTAVYSLANGQLFASIGFETMQEMAGALSDDELPPADPNGIGLSVPTDCLRA